MNFGHALIFLVSLYYSSATAVNQKSDNSCLSKIKCKIPAGFKIIRGMGAYKYIDFRRDWNTARESCINYGGHLAIIRSKAEEDLLRTLLKGKKGKEIWIGYHDQFAQNQWVSILDEPLERIGYKHWNKGEPNNWNKSQHCVKLTTTGWDDFGCNKAFPFFCKIDLNCQL